MSAEGFFVPQQNVMTSIVLPTIIFCIGMVIAMLVGINKCKQWELDKVGEMRRTRRVLQRVTNRLREKNFKTIQKARDIRKRAAKSKKCTHEIAPPVYASQEARNTTCGTSPPPTYEDALLDEYYRECHPSRRSIPVPDTPRRYSRSANAARTSVARRNTRTSSRSVRKVPVHNV